MKITNKKVAAAFAYMVYRHAFFANILFRQNIKVDNTCPTFYVDGVNLGFNEKFADSLTREENIFVLAHEVLHLCLMHHIRRGSRDPEMWNEACDYAINLGLVEAKIGVMPKMGLIDAKYRNMSAEDIYAQLQKDPNRKNKNGKDGKDGKGNGIGEVRDAANKAEAEEKAKVMTAQASSIAKQMGSMPAGMLREIEAAQMPKHDWREILNRFLTETCARDYSFQRVNKRHLQRGIILPSLYNKTVGDIVIVIDTSGSVGGEELKAILSETRSALAAISDTRESISVPVIYIDAAVHGHDVMENEDDKFIPRGGGGTSFEGLVPYMQEQNMHADAIIFITDGYTGNWGIEPECPLIWMFTNNASHTPPFGEKQYIDLHS